MDKLQYQSEESKKLLCQKKGDATPANIEVHTAPLHGSCMHYLSWVEGGSLICGIHIKNIKRRNTYSNMLQRKKEQGESSNYNTYITSQVIISFRLFNNYNSGFLFRILLR